MTICPKCGSPAAHMESMVSDWKFRCIDSRCKAVFFLDEKGNVEGIVHDQTPDAAKTQVTLNLP